MKQEIQRRVVEFRQVNIVPVEGVNRFMCLACGSNLKRDAVRYHVVERHIDVNAIYECPLCARRMRRRRVFLTHMKHRHPLWNKVDVEIFRVEDQLLN